MNTSNYRSIEISEHYFVWDIRTITSLIICIAIPLFVGAISALFSRNAMATFDSMNKPPLAPPAWLFPIAWTILYILMGIASFFIVYSVDRSHYIGIVLYLAQLAVNFMWSLIFFRFGAYDFAAIWLGLLIALIVALMINTARYSMPAMLMLIPYVAWCGFAMYLNIGIAMRNPALL